jgi:hypothetical protein
MTTSDPIEGVARPRSTKLSMDGLKLAAAASD